MNEKENSSRTKGLTSLHTSHTEYPGEPAAGILETFPNEYQDRDYWVTFDCPEFTARCPVTHQPDFGRVRIRYVPDRVCLESKSLKLYLFAFRNHPTFHEDAVNRILDDICQVCRPRSICVTGEFNPRGGIRIEVEASHDQQQNEPQ